MLILIRPINLRNTLRLKYEEAAVYRNILAHSDLPYTFDEIKRPWWRYYSELYGFSYSRVHRSYDLWVSNGLKRNIRLFMPFLLKMPSRKIKTTDSWKKRTFLYKNTTFNKVTTYWNNPKYFNRLNLSKFNLYTTTKECIYYNFRDNLEHFAVNPFGLYSSGDENVFSGFNAKWHDSGKYSSGFYRLNGMAPTNNLVGINDYYMYTSLFINLFDTTLILSPKNYLIYFNNVYNRKISDIIEPFLFNVIKYWKVNFNFFYVNILILFIKLLNSSFLKKIKIFTNYNLKINDSNFNIYNINLYILIYKYMFHNKYEAYKLNLNNIFKYNKLLYLNNNNNVRANNIFIYKNKKNNFNYINSKFYYINSLNFNKGVSLGSNIFKNYFLNNRILNNSKKFIKFFTKNKQSLAFINLYRALWTFRLFINYKKKKNLKNFILYLNNNIRSKKNYSYNYISKFSQLNYIKKHNLDIKRVLIYGKLFLRVPSKYIKHKFGYNKYGALLANKGLFRTILFSVYNKKIYKKIARFTFNIFFVLNLSIKLNFGFNLSLLKNKFNYFLTIENYINKYFLFINKLFKIKTSNLLKKNYFYNRLLVNLLQYKLTSKNFNNIKKLFNNKVKILNYSYKGLILKVFKKNKKYNR